MIAAIVMGSCAVLLRVRGLLRALGAVVGMVLCAACVQMPVARVPVESPDVVQVTLPTALVDTPTLALVCVHGEVGEQLAVGLDCLNQALATVVDQMHRIESVDAIRPERSAITRGVVHEVAVRQRLGSAFGVSVHPQRPASVVRAQRARP